MLPNPWFVCGLHSFECTASAMSDLLEKSPPKKKKEKKKRSISYVDAVCDDGFVSSLNIKCRSISEITVVGCCFWVFVVVVVVVCFVCCWFFGVFFCCSFFFFFWGGGVFVLFWVFVVSFFFISFFFISFFFSATWFSAMPLIAYL